MWLTPWFLYRAKLNPQDGPIVLQRVKDLPCWSSRSSYCHVLSLLSWITVVRKVTGQGFDAKLIQQKSTLQLQNISTFIYIYLHLRTVLCFLSLVIRPGVFFFFVLGAGHFALYCPCAALVFCPAGQHCLLSGNNCESLFCSYRRFPLIRERKSSPCLAEAALPLLSFGLVL